MTACSDDDDADEDVGDIVTDPPAAETAQESEPADATDAEASTVPGGETDDGDSGSDAGDSCSLVTAAEVTQAMGVEYGEGVLNEPACEYNDAGISTVYVTLMEPSEILTAELMFEATAEGSEGEEFDGPGDRAAWGEGFDVLTVLDGDRVIKIQIADEFPDEARDKAIALMELALA